MKRTNKTVTGRQWRAVPEDPKHMTVYGTEMLTEFKCRTCKGHFLISQQYKGHEGYCCDCWNKDTTKRSKEMGYSKRKKKDQVQHNEPDHATLLEFFV